MIQTLRPETHPIDALIARHGALPVLLRAMRALLRRPKTSLHSDTLSLHLRRDIGLPPTERLRHPWEHMR